VRSDTFAVQGASARGASVAASSRARRFQHACVSVRRRAEDAQQLRSSDPLGERERAG
jgi:hypothetical protein